MADVFILNKVDAAASADVQRLSDALRAVNPRAAQIRAASPVRLDNGDGGDGDGAALVRGRRALVIEDGPTTTHGGMGYGAGYVAAVAAGAAEIVDPRPAAAREPEIAAVFSRYPHLSKVLPAAVRGADAVYTDAWLSMGDPPSEREARVAALSPYQVNAALMAQAGPGALFLHCLPDHRGEEVTAEVVDGPRSVVFDQAENRLHTSAAILCALLSGELRGAAG
jgi:ornithine carbamoyltransferase